MDSVKIYASKRMAIVSSVHCPSLCMVLKRIMFCCGSLCVLKAVQYRLV